MQASRNPSSIKTKYSAVFLIICLILWIILIFSNTILKNQTLETSSISPYVYLRPNDNVPCHYSKEHDALPSFNNNFSVPRKVIFFHETSCRQTLDPRQSCALEAAARMNEDWSIYLLRTGPVSNRTFNGEPFRILHNFSNINFYRIHIDKYVKGTPLEWIANKRRLKHTKWHVSHISDILRYLSLYKYGGVALDLDVITARPFDTLESNWAGKENSILVGSAAIAFSLDTVGRQMAKAAIKRLIDDFYSNNWTSKGPDVITKILQERCNTDIVSVMSKRYCEGFQVYDTSFFFPVHWTNYEKYFYKGQLSLHENYAYGYHMWNSLSESLPIEKGSPYSVLAHKLCPSVYAIYKKEFEGFEG